MEPIGGGLGLGRGGEQGAFVGSKDAQPMREVGGVIGPRFIGDAGTSSCTAFCNTHSRTVE